MKDKLYFTTKEILDGGMLKNYLGEPYRHRASVVRVIKKLKYTTRFTRGGITLVVSKDEIARYNEH